MNPSGGAYGQPYNAPPRYTPPGQGYGVGAPQGYAGGAPQGYSVGAPPGYAPSGYGGGYGGQAPSYGGAMASGAPPPGVSPELWHWFLAVDTDKNGKITAEELQRALVNGNWSPFNAETCRLMVGMFDKDRNGTIDIHEFTALWKYIQDWKACFDRFDTDRSGNIDANELSNAFRTFGYNLSIGFSQMCVRLFDRDNRNCFQFDDFIQCCVMLKALTDKFREKDREQKGLINIHYEEFLRMVLDNTIVL